MAEQKAIMYYYSDGTENTKELFFEGTMNEFLAVLGTKEKLGLGDRFTYQKSTGNETVRVNSITENYKDQNDFGTITYHIVPLSINPNKAEI